MIDLVCFIRPPHKIIFLSSRFPDHPPNHSWGLIFVVTNLLPDLMTVLLIAALESTIHPEEENISQGTPSSLGNVPLADPVGTLRACDAVPERRGFPSLLLSKQGVGFVHSAFIQVSEPVSLTATSVKKIRAGLPSAVPRWSVETRRGPAFLYPAQVVVTLLGFFGPPRR